MLKQDIKVAADAIVLAKDNGNTSILLIQRKNDPYKGMWAFPGGFVEDDEDLEPAAIRELKEETGVALEKMEQLRTYGTPGRDPRMRTVSIVFYAIIDKSQHIVKADDDAADARWFDIKTLPPLAFDHDEIMAYALKHIPLS
ncbi:MAG: NUDIX hydrolase [Taibaiella sp.]|nr:NUDIX hydrolase [Taibaiella sp.]